MEIFLYALLVAFLVWAMPYLLAIAGLGIILILLLLDWLKSFFFPGNKQ